MKKLLLGIFCLIFSFTAFAQVDENYSIGLRAFSIVQMPKILNQTNSQSYTNTFFNGVLVKFNDNQISYRLNANYNRKDISFTNQCESCEIATGTRTDYSFGVGFEKSISYAKIQPYFGSEIGFRATNFNGDVKGIKNNATAYQVDTDKKGLLLTPLLGLKVTPIKHISFFAETSLNFFYAYERQELIQLDAANTRSFSNYTKWEFLLNPVSLGIQIHLVNKN